MKNIMKKTLLVSFIILFCLSCALTVLSLRTKNVNAEIIVQNENIADYYVLNDSKVFPEKISVDYAGKSYEASNGIVEFPGGVAEKIGKTPIDLKTIGKCYAKYYFKSDAGELVTAVDDFVVSDKKFNFTMNNGSSVTIAEETTEICANNSSNVLYTGKKGMILRLNEGSSFKYNVPIDLSKSNADGLCEIMTVDPRLNRVSYVGDELTVNNLIENGTWLLDSDFIENGTWLLDTDLVENGIWLLDIDLIEIGLWFLDTDFADEDGYVVDKDGNYKLNENQEKYKAEGYVVNENRDYIVDQDGEKFKPEGYLVDENYNYKLDKNGKKFKPEGYVVYAVEESKYDFKYDENGEKFKPEGYVVDENGDFILDNFKKFKISDYKHYVVNESGNFKLDAFNRKYKNNGDEIYRMGGLVAENLIITLTDCYDSSKFVQIVIDCQDEAYAGLTYLRARLGGTSNSYGSFSQTENAPKTNQIVAYQDGVRGIVWNDRFGVYHSGKVYIKTDQPFSIFYDNELNRIYYTRGTSKKLLLDFSNASIYGASAFEGFSTGEVFLSIAAENYLQHEPARVDIISIGGSVDNATNLNDSVYVDTVKPIVEVDMEKTNEFGVYAAKDEKFIIPDAIVTDVNYSGNLSVRVYRNYGLINQSLVSISDNSFKVDYADTYTVLYSATDDYGNVGEATFNVVALNKESSLSISVSKLENLYFGEPNVLPTCELETINKKPIELNIYLVKDGKKQEIDTSNMEFKPDSLGEYEILYVYSDNVNTKEFSYKVNCVGRKDAVFIKTPDVYKYYIKDAEYAFNALNAMVKQSDGSYAEVPAELYLSFDGGEFNKVTNLNKVKITGAETVSVQFRHGDAFSEISSAKIVEVGYDGNNELRLRDYFLGDFSVKTLSDDGQSTVSDVTYVSNVKEGNNVLKFINPLSYQNFKFEYLIPADKNKFTKLNVKLIDRENEENTIVISIRNTDAEGLASVNGSAEFGIGEKSSGGYSIRIAYNYDRGYFYVGSTKHVFAPVFNGDSAYLEVEMEGIYGASAITVKAVNNVNFSNQTKKDSFAPELWFEKYYGQYEINHELTLASIVACDVLSPINVDTKTIKVTTPSGAFAVDKDGKTLNGRSICIGNVTIALTEYGTYNVFYQVSDAKGNPFSLSYSFYVVDKIAPTIEFNGDFDENNPQIVKAGRKIKVEYSVSDNLNDINDLYVQINLYDNRLGSILVNVGSEIVIDKAGEYTLYVYCIDTDGNASYRYYKIIVE